MKKIILCLLAVAALGFRAEAQNSSSLGIRAGLNVPNLRAKYDGESNSFDSKASFHVGVAYQQPLLRVLPLYLETGLYLAGKGAKSVQGVDGVDATANMLYLQIPLLVSWHFKLGSVSLQPYAGAFYAIGIRGKLKADGEKIDLFSSSSYQGIDLPQTFKRSDVGLRFGVGATIKKHFYVGAGYDLGLTNILKYKEDSDASKIKTGTFYLSVGFNFW